MKHEWRRRELIDELERVTTQLGQLPSRDTMKMWGEEPPSAYDQLFGSFKQALSFIDDPEEEEYRPSRQELLQELQRIAFQRNGILRRYHLYGESKFPPKDYDREFGSVKEALIKTGLIQREEELEHEHSDSDVIADIQRVDYQLDGVVTVREYIEYGDYSFEVVRNKWETWRQALAEGELIQSREDYQVQPDELVADVERVGEMLERRPTREDYITYGGYSIEEFNEAMGWTAALALAGYDPPNRGRKISKNDLVTEFQRLTQKLGHRPSREEIREFGRYTEKPYVRVYGEWEVAREEIPIDRTD